MRPSEKSIIRATSRFRQLRKVFYIGMTSEVRKCPKWGVCGCDFGRFRGFPRDCHRERHFRTSDQEVRLCASIRRIYRGKEKFALWRGSPQYTKNDLFFSFSEIWPIFMFFGNNSAENNRSSNIIRTLVAHRGF